ncbi:deoxyguanosinetriphosphate triphosphohydrolase [Alloalcanivorax xenomutans]|jgi:dGTPase|uniref:Deoxyguanosinetriphosphate triphosphohydrolase n=1 Tax=Alloalcanivorax xenomutans TaxID=1094342 RepID=A0A9Q3ZFG5_9GAMM|nr:deoxyguanosinetriphosphate triphosphohydrolase [Alloalcanivorax xenomutans]ERS14295.1 deoxyguanosinetriphosphate triphosphohydrolase [Alcanivorax sp. PN-3]PHS67812.1 MAG: deoxyguanosinetriphosphate triphosphohydrolase [Alcanivorax sp.]ARB47546.1 deoxyguanosinetriphosphate triphosphohydrolase [Alloalcanivorax xenomutans]MCE7507989.1 deoxyguanosinetriphosphate triphosphohydrolase [Alloalcanivorax xenomutans]MCE7523244.1 deoxyguanosinetriphosphate triphosphohydrolase [Alloalcanivorax xenomutan
MHWEHLLNKERLGHRGAKDETGRTAFLRDHDKIIFSGAFRRLARKTQVHPLATNDHVHNRLTHSLEVSCVGRTLGIQVGERLERLKLLPAGTNATDLGDIVQSACLAHDIGNPPFGHTGERAIRAWFQERGQRYLELLSPAQQSDLIYFEGNAQGFRILTKSEYHQYQDGMRLTYATLATFLKYPWLSAQAGESGIKPGKYSAFVSETGAFREVCQATGLRPLDADRYCRHPLAYLMEAADDFCYAIIDLEDGLEMDLLHWDEVYALLQPALPDTAEVRSLVHSGLRDGRKAALLRGKIIERFIEAGVEAFIANHQRLLEGRMDGDLLHHCEPVVHDVVENAKQLARGKVFEHPRKIELEIGAFEVMGALLDGLIDAALSHARGTARNYRHERIIDLIGRHSFPDDLPALPEQERIYQCIMRALDFLSGMTDNYATYLAKQFSGMAETRY